MQENLYKINIKPMRLLSFFLLPLFIGCSGGSKEMIFLEAESFTSRGGWVIDQQFMDVMGSPYLMAHGIGKVVGDASTAINIPLTGDYKIWVRTKNWTAAFTDEETPGIFKIKIGQKEIPFIFGKGKKDWHWEDGGNINLAKGQTSILLNDLTGFNGRIDALLFTTDLDFKPPDDIKDLTEFRNKWLSLPSKPPLAGNYDLVVAGGGIAGICASVTAARMGLKVALIQNRPVLGGNNSSEIRVHLAGKTNIGINLALGNVVTELEPESEEN